MPGMTAHTLSPSETAGRPAIVPRPAVLARDAAYLTAGLPIGTLTFSLLVTGLSLAAGLAITLAGIPVLVATLWAARWMGDLERRRAGWLLGRPSTRPHRPWTGGVWARTKAAVSDGGAWLAVLWGLLLLPIGTAGFAVAVSVWSTALGFATSPLWYWALPEDDDTIWLLDSHDLWPSVLRVLIGLALIPAAAWTCRGLAEGTARAARGILRG